MSVKRTHLLRGKQCCYCDAAPVCAAAGSCGLQQQLEDSGDSTSNNSCNSRHTTAQLPSILLRNFIAIELYPRHRLFRLVEGLWHATSAAASPAHLRGHMNSEQYLFLYRKSSMKFASFILPFLAISGEFTSRASSLCNALLGQPAEAAQAVFLVHIKPEHGYQDFYMTGTQKHSLIQTTYTHSTLLTMHLQCVPLSSKLSLQSLGSGLLFWPKMRRRSIYNILQRYLGRSRRRSPE